MAIPFTRTNCSGPRTASFGSRDAGRAMARPVPATPRYAPDTRWGVTAKTPPRQVQRTNSATSPPKAVEDTFGIAPFKGTWPAEAAEEIAIPSVLPDDDRIWVPQTDTVSFRPLCFNVSQGYYVNLLRVKKAGLLSRHRHPGPVHGYVLKGKWKYIEHEWTASEGSETHTLVVLPGCEEMITMFHVTGALLYCDPEGNVNGYEDVFTKLEKAKEHYEAVGLGADFVDQFVR